MSSAVKQSRKVVEAMGAKAAVECDCGGAWFAMHGVICAAVHESDCPRADDEPPAVRLET